MLHFKRLTMPGMKGSLMLPSSRTILRGCSRRNWPRAGNLCRPTRLSGRATEARYSIPPYATMMAALAQILSRPSLQVKLSPAPVFGSDIGDGFGKVPAVAVEVLSVVLALAIGMVFRFAQDSCAIVPSALAMAVGIKDADLHVLRLVRRHLAFCDGEAAIAGFHLNAVVGDAQADGEAKCLRQPISCGGWIRVDEDWNHGAWRYRAVELHAKTLPSVESIGGNQILDNAAEVSRIPRVFLRSVRAPHGRRVTKEAALRMYH